MVAPVKHPPSADTFASPAAPSRREGAKREVHCSVAAVLPVPQKQQEAQLSAARFWQRRGAFVAVERRAFELTRYSRWMRHPRRMPWVAPWPWTSSPRNWGARTQGCWVRTPGAPTPLPKTIHWHRVVATSHRPAIPRQALRTRAVFRQGFPAFWSDSTWQVFLQSVGHARRAGAVDLIAFKTRHTLDEINALAPHGERGGCIAVGLKHIRSNDSEADDIA